MYLDEDIKIVGDKPSVDVKRNKAFEGIGENIDSRLVSSAKEWGNAVALKLIADAKEENGLGNNANIEMVVQRRLLLSFAATIGFEQFATNDTIGGIAQKSFLDTIKNADQDLYRTSSDTGAFSFYYLAFRRGFDVERRIGQTFAMLCSHDGDPIYHELGEAFYCWFLSEVKKLAEQFNIV